MSIDGRLPTGEVHVTSRAKAALVEAGQSWQFFVERHTRGDRGDVYYHADRSHDAESKRVSSYRTLLGVRLFVVTDTLKGATVVLATDDN